MLFLKYSPPPIEYLQRLLEHILLLPIDSSFPRIDYAAKFNAWLMDIIKNKDLKDILNNVMYVDLRKMLHFIFEDDHDIDQ